MLANPYVITYAISTQTGPSLLHKIERGPSILHKINDTEPGLVDTILRFSATVVIAYSSSYLENIPQALWSAAAPNAPNRGQYTEMRKVLKIERPRATISGHGPEDKLTVTFSDVVSRGNRQGTLDYIASRAEKKGWAIDKNAIYTAMDKKQTWTDVTKIRLVRYQNSAYYYVELLLQGAVSEETVWIQHDLYGPGEENETSIQELGRKLIEDVHLRHAVVDGVDEYSV